MTDDSYRHSFSKAETAADYEHNVFGSNSYASLLTRTELTWLQGFVERFPKDGGDIRYLDFACGTGRVISFMETLVGKAQGIDISAVMLDIARTKVRRSELLEADITQVEALPDAYDIITAFRFVLNAEPSLRHAVLCRLRASLADDDSRLVFNVQAMIPSHKSIACRLRPTHGANYLTHKEVKAMVADAGLELVSRVAYDFLSSHALRVLPGALVARGEAGLMSRGLVRRFGGHMLYVAKRRDGPTR